VLVFLTLPVAVAFLLLIGFTSRGTAQMALLVPGLIALPVYALIPSIGGGGVPLSLAAEHAKSVGRGLNMFVVMVISMALSGLAAWSWADGWFLWFVLGETAAAAMIYVGLRRSLEIARWTPVE
jgi:hypothetical protein